MNKLYVYLIFNLFVVSCNGQTLKKKVNILFENKKHGMFKFFDYSFKDSVFFIPLNDGTILYGIKFTPVEKSDTALLSDFFVDKKQLQNHFWVKKNLNVGGEIFWKFPKTYIVEKMNNDSIRITLCSYSMLQE